MVAINSRILYEERDAHGDHSYGFFPARRIKLAIRDEERYITGIGTTTNEGAFSFVTGDWNGGKTVQIGIGGCTVYNVGLNYAAKVAADVNGCNIYVRWRSSPFTIPETGDLNLGDLRINNNTDSDFQFSLEHLWYDSTYSCTTFLPCEDYNVDRDGGSVYFSIADAVLAGREYANDHRGGPILSVQ